jgi:hypothetical protein
MKITKPLFALLAFSLCTTALHAAAAEPAKPKTLADYPQSISQIIQRSTLLESAVSQLHSMVFKRNGGTDSLSKEDIAEQKQQQIQQMRVSQVSQVLRHDLNNDGSVTLDEIKAALSKVRHRQTHSIYDRQIEQMMQLDSDGDNSISYPEMRDLKPEQMESIERRFSIHEDLLKLDPTPDTPLTLEDLRNITKSAFALADTDGNNVLSDEEKEALMPVTRSHHPSRHTRIQTEEKLDTPKDNEIHVVGIYEGNERTDGVIHGPQAKISIDRPGQKVTLFLTSYDRVLWMIDPSEKTTIDQIVISSYTDGSKILVDGKERKPDVKLKKNIFTYKEDSSRFRELLTVIKHMTGHDRISSFSGKYGAPEEGFSIQEVSDDVDLKESRLEDLLAPADKIPKATFTGIVNGVPAEYDLQGNRVKSLPTRVAGSIEVPEEEAFYRLTSKGLEKYDAKGKRVAEIPTSLDVPTFSWATGITYDTKRNRVVISSFGGEGYLYAYYPKKDKWEVISSLKNTDIQRIAYDKETDSYIAVGGHIGSSAQGISLIFFSPDGERTKNFTIPMSKLPAFTDTFDAGNGPGPAVEVIPTKEHYILISSGSHARSARNSGVQRIYAYDRESEKVMLTWAAEAKRE